MDSSSLVTQLYKARVSILEQLQRQGYNVDSLLDFGVSEVNSMYRHEQLDFTVDSEDGRKTMVKFYLTKALRPANLRDMVDELFEIEEVLNKENDTLYIVANSDPNDTLLKTLNIIWQTKNVFVNINGLQRLQANILKHSKVPEHIVLNKQESIDVRKKYNLIRNDQIPAISRFDPVAVALGMRPGQMCKIKRFSPTAGTGIYYRLCLA